jgi:hypothetical protein
MSSVVNNNINNIENQNSETMNYEDLLVAYENLRLASHRHLNNINNLNRSVTTFRRIAENQRDALRDLEGIIEESNNRITAISTFSVYVLAGSLIFPGQPFVNAIRSANLITGINTMFAGYNLSENNNAIIHRKLTILKAGTGTFRNVLWVATLAHIVFGDSGTARVLFCASIMYTIVNYLFSRELDKFENATLENRQIN